MYQRLFRPLLAVVLLPWIFVLVLISLLIVLGYCLFAWGIMRCGSATTRAERGTYWNRLVGKCASVLRWLIFPLLGIRCSIDLSGLQRPLRKDEQVLLLAQHPSWAGLPIFYAAMHAWFPGPLSGVFKQELKDWPVGKAFEALSAVCFIDRGDRQRSIERMATWARSVRQGTLYLFVEGHRTTRKRVLEAQEVFRKAGREDLATAVRTSVPKTGGPAISLSAVPPGTRVVCGYLASTTHEEGFFGILRLVYGGEYRLKFFDASPPSPTDEEAFQAWVNTIFVLEGGAWIDEIQRASRTVHDAPQNDHAFRETRT